MQFRDQTSVLGLGSVTIAKTFILPNETSALQPFLTATAYNDFGGRNNVDYVSASGSTTNTSTTNLGTYGEVSAGLNFRSIQPSGFDFLREFSASVRGDLAFGAHIKSARITANVRIQF